MSKYKVTKEYHYTTEVTVEADSAREAQDKADSMEDERNYDDYLYDSVAELIEE